MGRKSKASRIAKMQEQGQEQEQMEYECEYGYEYGYEQNMAVMYVPVYMPMMYVPFVPSIEMCYYTQPTETPKYRLPKNPISYVVPTPEPITTLPMKLMYPTYFSNQTSCETVEFIQKYANMLVSDYGMNRLESDMNVFKLKYHFMEISFKLFQSSFFEETDCLGVDVELSFDMVNAYNNTIDILVFDQISMFVNDISKYCIEGETKTSA